MSNLGLGNLATVKAFLNVATALTDYDTIIATVAKGAAGQVNKHCNRLFDRAVGTTEDFPGDYASVIVSRYPIETLTSVALQSAPEDAFEVIDDTFRTVAASGIVDLGEPQGSADNRIRVTYTGGYFFETKDTGDTGYPTSVPSGSTALPDDVLLAWLLQVEHIWSQRDNLGLSITNKPGARSKVESLKLCDQAEELLRPYIRHVIV